MMLLQNTDGGGIMGGHTGINNETLKRRNRGLILQLIATGECATRTDLTGRTGLSKMSVSNVISEFLDQGIVEEQAPLTVRGQGRNPIALTLSPRAPRLIGLHIFQDECVAVRCDLRLRVEAECRVPMDAERARHLEAELFRAVDRVLPPPPGRVLGIGIGSTGPVELRRGMILNAPRLFGVHDIPVVAGLSARYGLPVAFDSQYNCAALAEKYFGAGRPYQDFLFVGVSNGVGSGVIAGGQVLRSEAGLTSELGHISIDWRGNPCSCGNRGCLETYVSTGVLVPRLRAACGVETDFPGYCRLLETGAAPELGPVFGEMVEALACGLTSAVNALNPQAVLIGHDGAYLPDGCLRDLEARINAQKLASGCPVRVLRPALGPRAQVRSSACCLLPRVFEGEML